MLFPDKQQLLQRGVSFWIGLAFVLLGAWVCVIAILQYRKILKALKPVEIPAGYHANLGVFTNAVVAALGVALIFYLFAGA